MNILLPLLHCLIACLLAAPARAQTEGTSESAPCSASSPANSFDNPCWAGVRIGEGVSVAIIKGATVRGRLLKISHNGLVVDLFRERNTHVARRVSAEVWRVVQRKLKATERQAGRSVPITRAIGPSLT